MKIAEIRYHIGTRSLPRHLRNATVELRALTIIFVEIVAEDGAFGEAIGFTINPLQMPLVTSSLALFSDLYLKADSDDVGALLKSSLGRLSFIGQGGAPIHALALLDSALWDLRARALGVSLGSLLGRSRDRVPVYASQGLWVDQDIGMLIEEAQAFVDAGYRMMKLRLCCEHKKDMERITALRKHLAPDIALMVDANQGMSFVQARDFMADARDLDLEWLEEPFLPHQHDEMRQLRALSNIPLATGESDYTRHGFARLIKQGCADVLMPDLQRVGGVSEFVAVTQMAQVANLPVSSHLFPEMSLQLLAHAPLVHSLEMVDWFASLYEQTITLENGYARVPNLPGWGFDVRRTALKWDYQASL
ncbi:mandelate racemase/muconate lactonizing enzyme family protein [Brucellaceae bacterium D45D]